MSGSSAIWSGASQTWTIPLWRARWGKDELLDRRGQIGSRAFARGFRQETLGDEERSFPSVQRCAVEDLDPLEMLISDWPRYAGVDLSSDKRPGNTIVTITQRPGDRKRMVVDVRAGSWTSPETWRQMEEVDRRFYPQVFLVENNALQDSIIQWGLERNATLPVRGFVTGKNKADPSIGLPGLEVEFENEGWMIPRPGHELDCGCAWCRLWTELMGHPLAESTDLVMALWFAREAARATGRSLQEGPSPLTGWRG